MKVKVFPPRGCDRSALDAKSWMELPEGSTLLVSVNGERAKFKHVLHDGDVVGFFSLVTGG